MAEVGIVHRKVARRARAGQTFPLSLVLHAGGRQRQGQGQGRVNSAKLYCASNCRLAVGWVVLVVVVGSAKHSHNHSRSHGILLFPPHSLMFC